MGNPALGKCINKLLRGALSVALRRLDCSDYRGPKGSYGAEKPVSCHRRAAAAQIPGMASQTFGRAARLIGEGCAEL